MRVLRWVLIAVALLLSAAVAAAMVATQTDFGRNLVKRIALNAASKAIHGRVRIGRLGGDLLSGATLDSISITDSTGAPFVSARRIAVHYGVPNLLKKRLWLRAVELDDPVIVLDQSPAGAWNFSRIFPSSNTPSDTSKRGFGDWIAIRGLRIVNGTVIVRQPRKSDNPRLVIVGNQQVTEVDRLNAVLPLVRIADPAQKSKLAQIASLNADLAVFKPPIARIDNLTATIQIDNDSLWMHGARVDMPGSKIEDISTRFGLKSGDLALQLRASPVAMGALRFAYPPLPAEGTIAAAVDVRWRGRAQDYAVRGLDVRTGAARAEGDAQVHMGDSMYVHDTHVVFAGVDTRLIERVAPGTHLPHQGVASGSVVVDGSLHDATLNADLGFDDTESGPSHLDAVGALGMDSSAAHGRVFHARHLVLTLDRVQLELAETFVKKLPVTGEISGRVDLDGSTTTAIVADADLLHDGPGSEQSHVVATANAQFEGRPRTHPWLDVNATLDPVSLTTAGHFAPTAGLHGAVSGTAHVIGDLGDLTLHSHLIVQGPVPPPPPPPPIARPVDTVTAPVLRTERAPGMTAAGHAAGTTLTQAVAAGEVTEADVRSGQLGAAGGRTPGQAPGQAADSTRSLKAPRYSLYRGTLGAATAAGVDTAGVIAVDGHMDLASKERSYDLTARTYRFNANAVTTKSPATTITATAAVKGHGTTPATMQATLAANVTSSMVDSVTVDTLVLRGGVNDGVANVDTAHVRLRAASADVTGTFGVTAKSQGHLTYRVRVDSLSPFRRFLPAADTTTFRPGPGRLADAYAHARGDTASGEITPERQLAMDTAAIRRDLLTGRVYAAGVIDGSMQRFNVRGRVAAGDLIVQGNSIRRLRAEYAWLGAPNMQSPMVVGAQLDTISIGNFALDSVDARVSYHRPNGSVLFLVRQRGIPEEPGGPPTHDQEYTANMDFAMRLEDRRIQFNALTLKFDTTTWTAPSAPAIVEWSPQGFSVHGFNLTNGIGGKIAVDANVPKSGPLQAHADIEHLHLGELIALFESKLLARGELSTTVDAKGTSHKPELNGSLTLANGSYNGIPVPDVRTKFDYNGTILSGQAELATNIGPTPGLVFVTADGHMPIDLALDHDTTSRIPNDGPIALNVKADSLPVELLPELATSISDVHGLSKMQLAVTGTINKPIAAGNLTLEHGTALVAPLNIRLADMAAGIRIAHDSLVIDSLVANSEGTLRVTGSVDLTDPEALPVDITQTADDFRAMNSKQYGWAIITDTITLGGSLRALSLAKPASRLVVGGSVRVTDGVFYAPEPDAPTPIDLGDPAVYKVADTTDVATKNLIPQPNTLERRLLVTGVDVNVDPQVWVRNKAANVEIYTDGPLTLRIDERRSRLVLDGVMATERGQYTFLSKRFQITKGTASFIGTPDLNPSVQATAVYPVTVPGREPVNIQIDIGGTAKTPTVKLTSDAQPPLSQSDLISYLAFGSSSASLLSASSSGGGGSGAGATGLPVGEAAAYVQQQLASVAIGTFTEQLQGDAARALDADVFNITNNSNTPIQFSQSGATDFLASTRVEFGKYWDNQTYFAVQASPLSWTVSPPGALVQRRFGQRTSILATFQPYFLLQQPSLTPLSAASGVSPTKVFGLFLLRDWRW